MTAEVTLIYYSNHKAVQALYEVGLLGYYIMSSVCVKWWLEKKVGKYYDIIMIP